MDLFLSAFEGLSLEAVFLDFQGSAAIAQELLSAAQWGGPGPGENGTASGREGGEGGVRHVIAWPADVAAPVLAGWDFARAFFGMLRCPGMTVPEVGGYCWVLLGGKGVWAGWWAAMPSSRWHTAI